jgi:hypothetical protein
VTSVTSVAISLDTVDPFLAEEAFWADEQEREAIM